MKWLSNLHDPRLPDHAPMVHRMVDETPEEAARHEKEWLEGKIIWQPKATESYTVEQLEAMHMVGIYLPETIDDRMMQTWGPMLYRQEQVVVAKEAETKTE